MSACGCDGKVERGSEAWGSWPAPAGVSIEALGLAGRESVAGVAIEALGRAAQGALAGVPVEALGRLAGGSVAGVSVEELPGRVHAAGVPVAALVGGTIRHGRGGPAVAAGGSPLVPMERATGDADAGRLHHYTEIRSSGARACPPLQAMLVQRALTILRANLDTIPETCPWGSCFAWLPSSWPRSPRALIDMLLFEGPPHLRVNCEPIVEASGLVAPPPAFFLDPQAHGAILGPGQYCAWFPIVDPDERELLAWSHGQWTETHLDVYLCPAAWTSNKFRDHGAAWLACLILHETFHALGIGSEEPVRALGAASFCGVVDGGQDYVVRPNGRIIALPALGDAPFSVPAPPRPRSVWAPRSANRGGDD